MIKLKGNALWTNKRKSFFIQYIVNLPNSLPQGVIETSTVAGFQRGLDNFMAVIKTRSPGAQITIGLIQPCAAARARTVGPSGGSCPHVLNVLDGAGQGIHPPLTRHGVLSLICDNSLFLSKNKRWDPRVSQYSPNAIGPLALRDLCGRWWPQPVACSLPGTRALLSSDAGAAGPGAALLRGTRCDPGRWRLSSFQLHCSESTRAKVTGGVYVCPLLAHGAETSTTQTGRCVSFQGACQHNLWKSDFLFHVCAGENVTTSPYSIVSLTLFPGCSHTEKWMAEGERVSTSMSLSRGPWGDAELAFGAKHPGAEAGGVGDWTLLRCLWCYPQLPLNIWSSQPRWQRHGVVFSALPLFSEFSVLIVCFYWNPLNYNLISSC